MVKSHSGKTPNLKVGRTIKVKNLKKNKKNNSVTFVEEVPIKPNF